MQYMFLLYGSETGRMSATPEQRKSMVDTHYRIMDDAAAQGKMRGANPLTPSAVGFTVRASPDGVLRTDGPFTETKEALGGYYLLDCEDAQEAARWAERLMETGTCSAVEVRALSQLPARTGYAPHE